MSDDVGSVAQLLYATLDPAPEKRCAAEAALAAGALQQGFALALTRAMLAPDLPPGLKQAAALALKLYVKVRSRAVERRRRLPAARQAALRFPPDAIAEGALE